MPSFSKCPECEVLRAALFQASTTGSEPKSPISQKDGHVSLVSDERQYYRHKTEMEKAERSQYSSMAFNGADQTKYTLPHFPTKTKDERGHGLD